MDFPGGLVVKNPQEMWVQTLGGEDPLEKKMLIYFGILAWRILWMEEPGKLQSRRSQKSQTLTYWLNNNKDTDIINIPYILIAPFLLLRN